MVSKYFGSTTPYTGSNVIKLVFDRSLIPWNIPFPSYNPPEYTAEKAKKQPWSDDKELSTYKFNEIDGNINRVSHMGHYLLSEENGAPLNPQGRTGIKGRGILGRYGPNMAADPIVSRFNHGKLQFVAIKRQDTKEWAIPGGMVDAGENVSQTLKREFSEEAMDGMDPNILHEIWAHPKILYKGYVDDPRNTDNAWMETVVANFHDHHGLLQNFKFTAGSDAAEVKWFTVEDGYDNLYASHRDFIKLLENEFK
uniref:Nudix hydrolase domain-containing protein n=1 Tax=Rhabditophanes sp. KR3021 TaxID=114890 RepID=A0AC35UBK7_9BILA